MAQFDVYENKHPKTRRLVPYLLDVQSDLLSDLATTVVIPLCLAAGGNPSSMTRLMPRLEIKTEYYLALTPQLAGISRKELGAVVDNVSAYRNDIIGALDFLITGI
ncbi:CcdB family protein [Crenothrix sp.]|uniref:CcdB family protein n=1 Tax=Crenothrix sp. TaxID=3100433 RepID=UPI00374D1CF1